MMYLGDFPADQAVYFLWSTNDAGGASITRATDGTISVYKDNSDGSSYDDTQVTTGITNDEDFDGLTGIHECCITTTDGWYEVGHDYTVVLSAATIDGQTVNAPLAHFSIENRAVGKSAAVAALVDLVWDEVITSAAHGTGDSGAYYLRRLHQTLVSRVEQCGDAGSATTIDLDAAASSVDDYYKGQLIVITAGTGAGQARACTGYNGTSKIATVGPAWATNPDGDSWFAVLNVGSTVVAAIDDIDLSATMKTSVGDAVRGEPITDAETLETLGGMIHATYCKGMQKKTVTNSAEVTYKLDDTTALRTQTLADDDTTVTRGGG
jgi:hypothetical protein